MFTAKQTAASVKANYGRPTNRSYLTHKPSPSPATRASTQATRGFRMPATGQTYRTGKYESNQNYRWGSSRNPARQVGFERPVSTSGGWEWINGKRVRITTKRYKSGLTKTRSNYSWW